jgi:hypothetical protein
MKILLDKCLPLDFRHSFSNHDTHTAQWAGLKRKKNGELLRAAEIAGYDVLLTVDQGIPHPGGLDPTRLGKQSSPARLLRLIQAQLDRRASS